MSDFRVRPGEPVAQELARIIESQLERAQARLGKSESDPETAFHEARRRIKKARAAARIARTVDKKLAREINATARDAARVLSDARDADVIAATARAIAEKAQEEAAAIALRRFAEHAAEQAPAPSDREELAEDASRRLDDAMELAAKLGDREASKKSLKRAAKRAVKRAAEAFAAAHRHAPAAEAPEEVRHEWRKRVKELAHVERLLGDVWPLDRPCSPDLSKALGQRLGEERDLLLLEAALRSGARLCGGAEARNAALALVRSERLELLDETAALGRRVHPLEPAASVSSDAKKLRGRPRRPTSRHPDSRI